MSTGKGVTMIKRIHINQHVIRSNSKTGDREPVITVKTSKQNTYCDRVILDGLAEIIYSPDKPLSCGAKVWIETSDVVECWDRVEGEVVPDEYGDGADYTNRRVVP